MPFGDNDFGDVAYGDIMQTGVLFPIMQGIYPINKGGMLIDYTLSETSNAIYDLITFEMIGMVGRKIR